MMQWVRILPLVVLLVSLVGPVGLSGCRFGEPSTVDEEPSATSSDVASDIVQLTPEAARMIDVRTARVESRTSRARVETTGVIRADENRVFRVNSFVGGRIVRDAVALGDFVRRGQTMAMVRNAEIGKIQAAYIHELHANEIAIQQAETRLKLAQKSLERERRLLAEDISPRKDYQQAEAEAETARTALAGQREHRIHIRSEGKALLSVYGVSPGGPRSEAIRTESPVIASASGVITRKNVTVGSMVTPDSILYEISDRSRVWLDIAVYPGDLEAVRPGQRFSFLTDSLPRRMFIGTIDYMPPEAEMGRIFTARAFLKNDQGLLKPGMFGAVQIEQGEARSHPFIPEAALQRYGREAFVFIPLGGNRYRKQTIIPGERSGAGYAVNSGLSAGQSVVTRGSFALKAEMLKSVLGEPE